MKIDLLDRPRLELLNKRGLKYHLQDAEKDYFMAIILNVFYNSAFRESLVFKGGTAIYHCYLERLRFSKDLDFASKTRLTPPDIEKLFLEFDIFKVKDIKDNRFGLDISVQYRGPLGQPDTVGIDINTNQRVLREPKIMEYKNYYGPKFLCLLMDIEEIFAEKIRTLNDRARPRDLYDLVILQKRYGIKIRDGLALVSQKESHSNLDKRKIMESINISLNRWEQEMKELYYREPVSGKEVQEFADKLLEVI